jgi:hypothetical protein
MSAEEEMERWMAAEPLVVAAIAYGSRKADLDYFVFIDKATALKPWEAFPKGTCLFISRSNGCLIGKPARFDIAYRRMPLTQPILRQTIDMLRNCDNKNIRAVKQHPVVNKQLQDAINAYPQRFHRTDADILAYVRTLYVNWLFVNAKRKSNPLHVNYLVSHVLKQPIWELARQVDLRRGGMGKWRGRDYESTFDAGTLEMLAAVDDETYIDKTKECVLKLLKELQIEPPNYIKQWKP